MGIFHNGEGAGGMQGWDKKHRDLAKLKGFDIQIEDHGLMMMAGTFYFDSSSCQGFGYCINIEFVRGLMEVFNANKLQDVNGKSCWVTHDRSKIYKLEPLHKDEGKVFEINAWIIECMKVQNPKGALI